MKDKKSWLKDKKSWLKDWKSRFKDQNSWFKDKNSRLKDLSSQLKDWNSQFLSKKSIYIHFCDQIRSLLIYFWSISNFLIKSEHVLIDFFATIDLDYKNSDR